MAEQKPREFGLVFGDESILAFRDGNKSQTRRLPSVGNCYIDGHSARGSCRVLWPWLDFGSDRVFVDGGPSPAGNAGPYLHVPEKDGSPYTPTAVHRIYPAVMVGDHVWAREAFRRKADGVSYRADEPWCDLRWTSPIYMPRVHSRFEFKVAEVMIHRLQELTREQAIAEGCPMPTQRDGMHPWPEDQYRAVWDQLNAKRGASWDSNPWVFAYRLEPRR